MFSCALTDFFTGYRDVQLCFCLLILDSVYSDVIVLSEIKKKEKEKQKAVRQEGACSRPVYARVLDLCSHLSKVSHPWRLYIILSLFRFLQPLTGRSVENCIFL